MSVAKQEGSGDAVTRGRTVIIRAVTSEGSRH